MVKETVHELGSLNIRVNDTGSGEIKPLLEATAGGLTVSKIG